MICRGFDSRPFHCQVTALGKFTRKHCIRGVATGVDIGIYRPPKSVQVNFLWGKMTSERLLNSFISTPQKNLYTPTQKNLYTPQKKQKKNKFLATPLMCMSSLTKQCLATGDDDALWLERWPQAWWKVMAAYPGSWLCHLQTGCLNWISSDLNACMELSFNTLCELDFCERISSFR